MALKVKWHFVTVPTSYLAECGFSWVTYCCQTYVTALSSEYLTLAKHCPQRNRTAKLCNCSSGLRNRLNTTGIISEMLLIESVKLLCNEREYLKINKVIKSNANTFEYINLKFGNTVLIFSFRK